MTATAGLNLGWGSRLPVVLQSEAAECALACVTMVARYHGAPADLAEVRRRFGMSLTGATLSDVVRIAERLNLASRAVRLELEELPQLSTPCILHWDLNHFVVLKSADAGGIVILTRRWAFGACRWPRCPDTSLAWRWSSIPPAVSNRPRPRRA